MSGARRSGPLNNLLQDGSVDVRQRHDLLVILVHAEVLQHSLNGDALLCDVHIHGEYLAIRGLQLN